MSGKENPEVVVRRATLADYKGVMDIDRNIYEGLDYLPYFYHILLQNKNSFPYLAEVDGKIVGFVNFLLIDGGQQALNMSGRIHPEYRGLKIISRMAMPAYQEIMKRCPQFYRNIWAEVDHPQKKNPGMDLEEVIQLRWRLYCFEHIGLMDLAKFEQWAPHIPVDRVTSLNLSQSEKLFSDSQTLKNLVPGEYFLTGWDWLPYMVSATNLLQVAAASNTSVLFNPDNTTVDSIAFMSVIKIQNGPRVDIFIYGIKTTAKSVLAHIFFWFRLIRTKLNPGVTLLVHFPYHVVHTEVLGELSSRLGSAKVSPTYDADAAICVTSDVIPQSKM